MLNWLAAEEYVLEDTGDEYVTIRCPWAEEHSNGVGRASYSPLGRGRGVWVERRAFNCFHEHCSERSYADLRDWVHSNGGPLCMGGDPLPWLQDRYVYVAKGKEIADMHQRPHGGVWRYELEEWSMANYRRIPAPGHDEMVLVKTAFLENPETTRADAFAYVPTAEGFTETNGQPVVNTYVDPTHRETFEEPNVFLDHIDYLLGDQQDIFLDWLAFKIQRPEKRSYALVMVAEDSFGTGRSWLRAMLERMLQGKVNTASLAQLVGKGTSAEGNYNDWAAECQFLVIEEAKDNLAADDFYKGYETFKQRVDTRTVPFRCNPKYGKTRQDIMYFNCLIFTNHSDAMILPENDRRVCVLENPSERQDYDYYDRLQAALDTEEPARAYWYLKHRDISGFDHVYPPLTDAKARMVEQSKSPVDEVVELMMEKLEGDIVTKKVLSRAVRSAARELDYVKIESDPGSVVGRLWRGFGRLRIEAKNGARYTIDSAQDEVRAIRNREKWIGIDEERDQERIVNELKLNIKEPVANQIFPK